ncbi:MAG: hypothetical protein JO198_07250, partial [Candidatus Dormibacteraeota bacterium]|nr:hypothetical protein [Candidatus Dormibacteraeota bacterium]
MRLAAPRSRLIHGAVLAGALAVIAATHLVGLSSTPPGLYTDEASIGYNAWTIAHHGVDQFGNAWPLLFRDFGDYKSPVSTYPLAPLTLLFPLTPALTRVPSAIAGIALAAVAALLALRITRSRAVALIVMLEAAFEPWFFHTARIDLEADLFTVLCFVVALCAIAGDGARRARSWVGAGVSVAVAPLAAQPGRFFAVVFVALVLITYAPTVPWRNLAVFAAPPVVVTAALLLGTAGAATTRLSGVSVFTATSPWQGFIAWIGHYFEYWNPLFLFIQGDPNLRHSSGFEGLLFVTAIPVLVAGIAVCIRRRREALCRLTLAGLLVAPLGPALTGGISARRDIVALPFVLLTMTFGWQWLLPRLGAHRAPAFALATATATAAGLYFADYAVAYPARAARAFDTGVAPALVAAHQAAGTHSILVSPLVPDAREEALFALLPAPGAGDPLATMRIVITSDAAQIETAQPGDVVVLLGDQTPPPGFKLVDAEA